MNPIAREVSSLLKSSSVRSPNSNGLSDGARDAGGSDPERHEILCSPATVRQVFGLSAEFGADSYLPSDNISLYKMNPSIIPLLVQYPLVAHPKRQIDCSA
jgi:hypothetical protein